VIFETSDVPGFADLIGHRAGLSVISMITFALTITETAPAVVIGTGKRLRHCVPRSLTDPLPRDGIVITEMTPTSVFAARISFENADTRHLTGHVWRVIFETSDVPGSSDLIGHTAGLSVISMITFALTITETAPAVVIGTGKRLRHYVPRSLTDPLPRDGIVITEMTPTGVFAARISFEIADTRRLTDHVWGNDHRDCAKGRRVRRLAALTLR
jgi:hypothetical protein